MSMLQIYSQLYTIFVWIVISSSFINFDKKVFILTSTTLHLLAVTSGYKSFQQNSKTLSFQNEEFPGEKHLFQLFEKISSMVS